MKIWYTIIKAKCLQIKNYLVFRLDKVTIIEIILFLCAIIFIIYSSLNDRLFIWARFGKLSDAWRFYFSLNDWLISSAFLGGLIACQRNLRDEKISLLLMQPLKRSVIATSRIIDVLAPVFLLLPVWCGWHILFTYKLSLNNFLFPGLLFQFLEFCGAAMLGMAIFLVLSEKIRVQWWLSRLVFIILCLGLLFASFYYRWFDYDEKSLLLTCLNLVVALVMITLVSQWSLLLRINYAPESLIKITMGKKTRQKQKTFLSLYLLFVPSHLRPLVKKDVLFALRRYRYYVALFIIFMGLFPLTTLLSASSHDAFQWQISLSIAAAYLVTNAAFRFQKQGSELLALIKSHPITAKRYWWGKFWVSFLPLVWMIVMGFTVLFFRFTPDLVTFFLFLIVSILVSVTFVFIQNNFSLYSYPFGRFAPLWYNLYIFTALAFFTTLLFPPLTIVFFLFGFLAIFIVEKRFENMEVS